jgi:hypothetical protein
VAAAAGRFLGRDLRPLDQFAAAIDDADVGGDITAARATSRAFANVAAAAEDTWTLQLRAVGYSVAT